MYVHIHKNIYINVADPKDTQEEHDPDTAEDSNHDPHFEPMVSLPEQEVKTLEEDEEELFKMRAKLYRLSSENEPKEWKERGTGDVKLLCYKENGTIRLLMRRDRTLKICANHQITIMMELKPNAGSDRAWVWNTLADESPKPEVLAIRFLNAENAQKFKPPPWPVRSSPLSSGERGALQGAHQSESEQAYTRGENAS
ncbi:hypothetical protein NHX12_012590 [Muraenolepis orangiensis]|uniref:Ran-specific GTPase-activating protein n=1 Tax=Muraenolepis orangiensis TaxID=630683 RepID=A0A9Q0DCA3_9TELE|nr:hypothetical protein NHX12_012590 [Muraenolepis orangiensis]